jgi:2-polyprenyl-6-methoxyphenol hydroxylase-like FAD-dependent oxidoreductase
VRSQKSKAFNEYTVYDTFGDSFVKFHSQDSQSLLVNAQKALYEKLFQKDDQVILNESNLGLAIDRIELERNLSRRIKELDQCEVVHKEVAEVITHKELAEAKFRDQSSYRAKLVVGCDHKLLRK